MGLIFSAWITIATAGLNLDYDSQMEHLLEQVRQDFAETAGYSGIMSPHERVMQAMSRVPRHAYVPQRSQSRAYFNRPMSIGHGQTISQPFIVALMTHALAPQASHCILEIGTGSGYQAAVLAELVHCVYTIEIIPDLADSASKRLAENGYDNIQVRTGDGWHGWPEHAPFDGIIVTAATNEIPPALITQLKPGGRLVLPVGKPNQGQMLKVVSKTSSGQVTEQDLLPVIFVPFTRAGDDIQTSKPGN